MRFSIILPAYKELGINKTIKLLLKQALPANMKLDKIFLVVCGYDNFSFLKNKKIKIIEENRRKGKSYAINLALKRIKSETRSDIVILQSADTLPQKNMLKNLLKPFNDLRVGITAARPVSMDNPENFVGFLNNLVWFLHHIVSLESPKVGEALAFRNIIKKIPKRLAADESYIESAIRKVRYKVIYVPRAVVLNRGPKNVSDFITQRRRIFAGHLHIKNKYGYEVSTMNIVRIIKAFLKYFKIKSVKDFKQISWLLYAIFLEAYARLLGAIDFYVFNKVPYIWDIIKTAKT